MDVANKAKRAELDFMCEARLLQTYCGPIDTTGYSSQKRRASRLGSPWTGRLLLCRYVIVYLLTLLSVTLFLNGRQKGRFVSRH